MRPYYKPKKAILTIGQKEAIKWWNDIIKKIYYLTYSVEEINELKRLHFQKYIFDLNDSILTAFLNKHLIEKNSKIKTPG